MKKRPESLAISRFFTPEMGELWCLLLSSDWLERSSIVSFISWLRRQRTPNPREITRMIARATGKTIL